MTRLDFPLPQIATGDLDISIVGQLPAANLPFGDEFEPSPVQMVGFEAAFGREGFQQQDLEDAPETRTTPSYSPTPMPNSTVFRSGFHRASGGNRKNIDLLGCSANVLTKIPQMDHGV
jgi:hypothetical protein